MTSPDMDSFDEVFVNGREFVSKDWRGLLEILDDIYPASIFTGVSSDPRPQIVTHLREIARLRGKSLDPSASREKVTDV